MSNLASVLALLQKDGLQIGGLADVPREHGGVSWGLAGLDQHFKTRGVPRGRITQIVGEQNCGKTNLALSVIASLHTDVDAGRVPRGTVLFVDTERTFEEEYMRTMGVAVDDPARFILMRPDDGIEAIDAMEKLIDTGEIDLVVLDSITFLIPRQMLEADVGKILPAIQARQNSMLVQRLVGKIARNNVAFVIVNHLGSLMKQDAYGNAILEPRGGAMLQNSTSVMVWLKKTARPVGDDGKPVTNADMNESVASLVTIVVHKNKLGAQHRNVPAQLVFGSGFDPVFDLFAVAIDRGVLAQKGAWVQYGPDGSKGKWNGKARCLDALAEDIELFQQLRAEVLAVEQ